MNRLVATPRLLLLAAVLALLLWPAGLPGATPPVAAQSAPFTLPAKVPTKKPTGTRLDSSLDQLARQVGQTSPAAIASRAPLSSGALVAVSIQVGGASAPIETWLRSHGAQLANRGVDVIEAYA